MSLNRETPPHPSPGSVPLTWDIHVMTAGFFLGFLAMLATLIWVIVRFVAPHEWWLGVVHAIYAAIVCSFVVGGFGGLFLSAGLLAGLQCLRGCCTVCGKKLMSADEFCECRFRTWEKSYPVPPPDRCAELNR